MPASYSAALLLWLSCSKEATGCTSGTTRETSLIYRSIGGIQTNQHTAYNSSVQMRAHSSAWHQANIVIISGDPRHYIYIALPQQEIKPPSGKEQDQGLKSTTSSMRSPIRRIVLGAATS